MFVTVNGVRLFFDVFNPKLAIENDAVREKPVMLCLHGGPGGDHQSLRPWLDGFADLAQIVYLDQRGGGRSERGAPDSWTLDQWGDDVAAVCEALGVVRPIVLGVSGGSMTALSYLARHPAHAGGAILVNPCARMDRKVLIAGFEALGGPEAGEAARAMYSRGAPEDVPSFFRHCLPHYVRRKADGPPLGMGRQTFNFAVSQHFFNQRGEAFQFDFRRRLGEVDCPVLALAGAHDPVTRAEWGREVAAALPQGRCDYREFPEASHMIMVDEPKLVGDSIREFVLAHTRETV